MYACERMRVNCVLRKNVTPSVSKYLSLLIFFFATLTICLIQKIIANM
jgi:hypothetical protein